LKQKGLDGKSLTERVHCVPPTSHAHGTFAPTTNTAPPFGLKQTLAILQAGGESNQRRIKNPTQSKTFPRFRKFREPSQIMGGYHQKVALWWWCKSWSDCGLCGCGKYLRILAQGK